MTRKNWSIKLQILFSDASSFFITLGCNQCHCQITAIFLIHFQNTFLPLVVPNSIKLALVSIKDKVCQLSALLIKFLFLASVFHQRNNFGQSQMELSHQQGSDALGTRQRCPWQVLKALHKCFGRTKFFLFQCSDARHFFKNRSCSTSKRDRRSHQRDT